MAAMLASVLSAHEATACVKAGVDIVDCKDPANGALGALAPQKIKDVVTAVNGTVPVSATVGDLPCRVEPILEATRKTAALGVDFVKIGLFTNGSDMVAAAEDVTAVIAQLGRLELPRVGLVAVLLADQHFDPSLIAKLALAGFRAVMIDTADKSKGSLLDVLDAQTLKSFVSSARQHGLLAGLAGRLRASHIEQVLALEPDIMGFRGALCRAHEREQGLDADALAAVRGAIPNGSAALSQRRQNPGKTDASVASL